MKLSRELKHEFYEWLDKNPNGRVWDWVHLKLAEVNPVKGQVYEFTGWIAKQSSNVIYLTKNKPTKDIDGIDYLDDESHEYMVLPEGSFNIKTRKQVQVKIFL